MVGGPSVNPIGEYQVRTLKSLPGTVPKEMVGGRSVNPIGQYKVQNPKEMVGGRYTTLKSYHGMLSQGAAICD